MEKRREDNGLEELGEAQPPQPPHPSPIRWLKLDQWTEEHRRIWCVNYEECLDRAILEHWGGWSCRECQVREEWRPSLD